MLLGGEPHTVVGVMPANFKPIGKTDVWTPLRPSPRGEGAGTNYEFVARLHPGVSIEQGSAEVEALGERLLEGRKMTPESWVRFGVVPLARGLAEDIRKPLYVLWIAVLCGFAAAHAWNLTADFPNHSPWSSDWAKYTDEGWYGNAAYQPVNYYYQSNPYGYYQAPSYWYGW